MTFPHTVSAPWWTYLTGGRPMRRTGCAFVDRVTGRWVEYYRDRFGREWMAQSRWALFRVPRNTGKSSATQE